MSGFGSTTPILSSRKKLRNSRTGDSSVKAALFNDVGSPQDLMVAEVGIPNPGPEQVLVRVCAAGVNPVDWKVATGARKQIFPVSYPWIPGWDLSGVVVELGANATRWQLGDAIFGYIRMMGRQVCC